MAHCTYQSLVLTLLASFVGGFQPSYLAVVSRKRRNTSVVFTYSNNFGVRDEYPYRHGLSLRNLSSETLPMKNEGSYFVSNEDAISRELALQVTKKAFKLGISFTRIGLIKEHFNGQIGIVSSGSESDGLNLYAVTCLRNMVWDD